MYGKHHSKEVIERMKQGAIKKCSKRVRCVETGEIFPSLCSLERERGFHHGNVSTAIKEGIIRYGFHWEFVDE